MLCPVYFRTGRLLPLAGGFVAHVFVYTYFLVTDVVPSLSDDHQFWVFACLAVLLGIGDGAPFVVTFSCALSVAAWHVMSAAGTSEEF